MNHVKWPRGEKAARRRTVNAYEIEVKGAAVFANAANTGLVIDTDVANRQPPQCQSTPSLRNVMDPDFPFRITMIMVMINSAAFQSTPP